MRRRSDGDGRRPGAARYSWSARRSSIRHLHPVSTGERGVGTSNAPVESSPTTIGSDPEAALPHPDEQGTLPFEFPLAGQAEPRLGA